MTLTVEDFVDETVAELTWIAARIKGSISTGGIYSERLHGPWVDSMIYYFITGEVIEPKYVPGPNDLEPVLNMYKIAPEHVKARIGPLIAGWKKLAYPEHDHKRD